MNYYQNLDILNSKRKQLYTDIQNISNDKELAQYLKNTSSNIDSLLESLFEDEGDYEEHKISVQEMLEFHIASLENLKNKLQQNIQESTIKLTDLLIEMLLEDRCKRIADRRYSKPSAYKSGAIVRCRKGNIWKGIKSEAFFIGEDEPELTEKQKETLRTWFKRKGAPGKTGGWVDCNTCREVDGKTKCKPCGRQKGEKRAKYPSCRPTPSQCKQPGKGKKWGKTK
jgi:hypothetical protein